MTTLNGVGQPPHDSDPRRYSTSIIPKQGPLSGPTENEQLLLDEQILRHQSAHPAPGASDPASTATR